MMKDRKIRFRWGSVALVAPLLVLAACGGSGAGGGAVTPALDLSVQVDGWSGGEQEVIFVAMNPEAPLTAAAELVSTGSITAAGTLTIQLPAPPATVLGTFQEWVPDYDLSDPAALGAIGNFAVADDTINDSGQFMRADSRAKAEGGSEAAGTMVELLAYVDRPLRIEDDGSDASTSTDLSMEPGWNFPATTATVTAEGVVHATSAVDPDDLNWYWVEFAD